MTFVRVLISNITFKAPWPEICNECENFFPVVDPIPDFEKGYQKQLHDRQQILIT